MCFMCVANINKWINITKCSCSRDLDSPFASSGGGVGGEFVGLLMLR